LKTNCSDVTSELLDLEITNLLPDQNFHSGHARGFNPCLNTDLKACISILEDQVIRRTLEPVLFLLTAWLGVLVSYVPMWWSVIMAGSDGYMTSAEQVLVSFLPASFFFLIPIFLVGISWPSFLKRKNKSTDSLEYLDLINGSAVAYFLGALVFAPVIVLQPALYVGSIAFIGWLPIVIIFPLAFRIWFSMLQQFRKPI
jgi:hypothetical protein